MIRMIRIVLAPNVRKFRVVERWGGDEDRLDLDLCEFGVGRTHDGVVLSVYAVQGPQGVRRLFTGDFGVRVAHESVPYFDGATTFEDVHPHWTSYRITM